jgi:hypothetical protein
VSVHRCLPFLVEGYLYKWYSVPQLWAVLLCISVGINSQKRGSKWEAGEILDLRN